MESEANDRFRAHLSAFVVLIAFATLLVATRLFVKIRIVKNLGADDFALICALACNTVSTVFLCREAYFGQGQYNVFEDGFTSVLSERLKCFYAIAITYGLSLMFTKLSFLLLYLRIFRCKYTRVAIWLVIGIVVAYSTWGLFASIFFCRPIHIFWDLSVIPFTSDKCSNSYGVYIGFASINVGTDVFVLLLPLPGLRHLMMPRSQKMGLILVFSLGIFICVFSGVRLLAILEIFGPNADYDFLWEGGSLGIWSAIEVNVGIICCCLPPLRPLVVRISSRIGMTNWWSRSSSLTSKLKGNFSKTTSTSKSGWSSERQETKSENIEGSISGEHSQNQTLYYEENGAAVSAINDASTNGLDNETNTSGHMDRNLTSWLSDVDSYDNRFEDDRSARPGSAV